MKDFYIIALIIICVSLMRCAYEKHLENQANGCAALCSDQGKELSYVTDESECICIKTDHTIRLYER